MNYRDLNRDSWNAQSRRYQSQSGLDTEILDFGDRNFPTNEDLHVIGDVTGKKVLELGCGAANIGVILAKHGALVRGVDISQEQLNTAREKAQEENVTIELELSSIEEYEIKETYDLVISICAFQYVDDLQAVFRKVYNGLRNGGQFILSTDHPAFQVAAAASGLWKDETSIDSYRCEKPQSWKWDRDDDFSFITFPHPVEYYINTLSECGFYIEKFHELLRKDVSKEIGKEKKLELLYPRYLVIRAAKRD